MTPILKAELPTGVSIDNDGSGDLILSVMNRKVIIFAKPHEFLNLALALLKEAPKMELPDMDIIEAMASSREISPNDFDYKKRFLIMSLQNVLRQEALEMEPKHG